MNRFLNYHGNKECSSNSKTGFQSLHTEVAALKPALDYYNDLADRGLLKNGDVIVMYARFTESNEAVPFKLDSIQLADGTVREVPVTETAATELTEDEIPF